MARKMSGFSDAELKEMSKERIRNHYTSNAIHAQEELYSRFSWIEEFSDKNICLAEEDDYGNRCLER